jgi:hypothetical protein
VNADQARALRALVHGQHIASLGTLHDGAPWVSMTPFALLPRASGFVLHVSQLSSHTQDMLESPRVSLLVVAGDGAGGPPQSRARLTVQGRAEQLTEPDPGYGSAREAYLARFPEAAGTFELADFSLFAIRPLSVRFIAGFAQALTLSPEAFATALNERT